VVQKRYQSCLHTLIYPSDDVTGLGVEKLRLSQPQR